MRAYNLCFLSILGLAACGKVHLGDHDSGVIDPEDGGQGPIVCGDAICEEGLVCCNASCGLCAAPDQGCAAIECQDGCTSNADCDPGQFCEWAGACGPIEPGHTGVCTDSPDACIPEISPTCGCDGATYQSACDARSNGVSVAHDGPCEVDGCAAQDARADDPTCPAFFGYAWNGEGCDGIGGCNCVGTDCDQLYSDQSECEAAHAMCARCGPQDAIGVGDCFLSFGIRWNGASCESVGGCECVGTECMSLYTSVEACQSDRADCGERLCTHTAQCAETEYCRFPEGSCGGIGECLPRPPELMCTFEAPVVCGCDGVTYGCESEANGAGTTIRHEGACTVGSCGPMDAEPSGPCGVVLGVRWNGMTCESFSGCSCVGADCMRIGWTLDDCEREYDGCSMPSGGTCGTIAGLVCRPDEWCDYPDAMWCGGDDEGGTCRPRPEDCTSDVDPACGCDGTVYNNPCAANRAGYDVTDRPGACPMM
jgi:hypothetical protein